MSTDIKPGQVWAWSNGNRVVVVAVEPDKVFYQYLDPTRPDSSLGVSGYDISGWLRNLSLVDADATPAPLDPSKVKAGDTVTLEEGLSRFTGVVDSVRERAAQTWFRFRYGEQADAYLEMPVTDGFGRTWTLTDHQPAPEPEPAPNDPEVLVGDSYFRLSEVPAYAERLLARLIEEQQKSKELHIALTEIAPAPEPEPEWKPWTVADIMVHPSGVLRAVRARTGNYWAADTEEVYSDDDVESVRPLVVIDPAAVDVEAVAAAIANELGLLPNEVEPMHREAAVGALAALGIEPS